MKRKARKLVLPLIAIGMMTTMMYLESVNRSHQAGGYRAPAAARTAHDVRQR